MKRAGTYLGNTWEKVKRKGENSLVKYWSTMDREDDISYERIVI